MKRFLSGALASFMLFGALMCGCGSKNVRERITIDSTDKWYSGKLLTLYDKCSAGDYDNFYFNDPYVVDGCVLISYNAYNNTGAPHDPICIFDEDGNLIREFELSDEVSLAQYIGVGEDNGDPVIFYASEGKLCKAILDKTSGEITGTEEMDLGGESNKIVDCDTCNGYIFALGTKQDKDTLYVYKDGSLIAKNEMFAPYDAISLVKPEDGGFMIRSENQMYFFDPDTGKLENGGIANMEDFINSFLNEVIGSDGRTYVKKEDGIYVDDQPYVMYTDTDCNMTFFLIADLLKVTDEKIVLKIAPSSYKYQRHGAADIIMLDKQSENPNAGKTVISALSYESNIDHMTGEAIRRFNSENKGLIPFRQKSNGLEHFALIKGEWNDDDTVMVRVHSSCATGDILGSKRCDCGEQLHKAMQMIEAEGRGVLVYMQQEGRGIGLMNKIAAYKLQEEGLDTVDANVHLGFKPDERDYGCGAQMLRHLGIHKMRLLTNNPVKRVGLEAYGLEIIENVPIEITPNPYNLRYLQTKRERMGLLLHF